MTDHEVRRRAAIAARFVLRSHDHQPHFSRQYWWDYYVRAAHHGDTGWLVGFGRVRRHILAALASGGGWEALAKETP